MNGDNIKAIDDCKIELQDIKKRIDLNPVDSMVKYLVSYAVIKSCGTIETVYKNILYNHVIQGANQEAISYFSRNIKDSSSNPSFGKISNLLEQLNPEWKNAFDLQLNSSNEKGCLTSLVNLRNDLAHGGSITSSIDNVITYFDGSCSVLNILDSIVK